MSLSTNSNIRLSQGTFSILVLFLGAGDQWFLLFFLDQSFIGPYWSNVPVSANCNLFFEIWSSQVSQKLIKLMMVLITSSWSSPDKSKSSTYWRSHMWGSNMNFSKTYSKIWPKRWGELVNPWGRTVHLYCHLCPEWESFHSKANMS
jgi:hypothetical protein